MAATWFRGIVVLVGTAMAGAAGIGCELMVQLDRSAVEVPDSGCPICSDASDDATDGADAASPDGE